MTTKTIEITKEFGNKSVSKKGDCPQVQTAEDVLTLLSEDQAYVAPKDATETEVKRAKNRVIDLVNYALDLKFRAKLTNALNSENVDPEKGFEKMLDQTNKIMVAMGLPTKTMDELKASLGVKAVSA